MPQIDSNNIQAPVRRQTPDTLACTYFQRDVAASAKLILAQNIFAVALIALMLPTGVLSQVNNLMAKGGLGGVMFFMLLLGAVLIAYLVLNITILIRRWRRTGRPAGGPAALIGLLLVLLMPFAIYFLVFSKVTMLILISLPILLLYFVFYSWLKSLK